MKASVPKTIDVYALRNIRLVHANRYLLNILEQKDLLLNDFIKEMAQLRLDNNKLQEKVKKLSTT